MRRQLVLAVTLGQLLSFLIAVTATTSTFLANEGISAPTLQSTLNYALLAAAYGTYLLWGRKATSLSKPWWCYALLGLLDVEANYCLVLAYRFTSLTSVTLLDCFTIPMAVVLSAVVLGARYRSGHYAGAAVCLAGLSILVLSDRSGGSAGQGPGRAWLGDALVLLGATLYAACNVVAEWLLGDVPVQELLAMQGAFGMLWSLMQGLPLELHTLAAAHWSPAALLPFLGFGLSMFAFYSLVPYQLQWGGAALLNLSLLTSDLWTALARLLLFGGFDGHSFTFFALAFAFVAVGIVLYTRSGDVYSRGSPAALDSDSWERGLDTGGKGQGQHWQQPPQHQWQTVPQQEQDEGSLRETVLGKGEPSSEEAAEEGSHLLGLAGNCADARLTCPAPECDEQPGSMAGGGAGGDCEPRPLLAGLGSRLGGPHPRPRGLGRQQQGASCSGVSGGAGSGQEAWREAAAEGEGCSSSSEVLHSEQDVAAMRLPLLRVVAFPRGAAMPAEEQQRFGIESPGAHHMEF
ncbi:hypothetical protein N2152v2_009529 [Parachlorella kessleri]